jgi:hypothetical protein
MTTDQVPAGDNPAETERSVTAAIPLGRLARR